MPQLQSFHVKLIDSGAPGPHVAITAGVHGDEYEGVVAVGRLAAQLEQRLQRGKVSLVPVVNEPAYRLGKRMADDGLDLLCQCPGDIQGSVTQRIAYALSELICSSDYYIDLHSGGHAMQVTPLVGYMLHDDARVLNAQRQMSISFNLPIVWGTSPMLQGRSLSVARDACVPAIYAEYLGGGGCCAEGVRDYVDGCLNVIGDMQMIEHDRPPKRVTCVIEDARPDSGHLQVAHPSPIPGIFEPAVELLQEVSANDLLGRVFSPFNRQSRDVTAQRPGIVICLVASALVNEGDGLAVVMETRAEHVTAQYCNTDR